MRFFRPAVCLRKLSVFRKFIKLKQWKNCHKSEYKTKKKLLKKWKGGVQITQQIQIWAQPETELEEDWNGIAVVYVDYR